ncbi:helix-turn-helix transcriptional regulator [Streptomyces globisporus]|uniref:ArsR/SmtB family transcription factor n=1 Tax=Streptomyces globisporus TaxID=1908 RepID=UPI0004C8544F|nr:winged helix-turn-helix domain-containing protein [Streptomyces globisporus]
MGEIRFGVDDLAQLRFAVSPLWESVAALRASADPGGHALHLPWIKAASTLGRERTGLLPHLPGLEALAPPPRCPLAEIEEELAAFTGPPERAEALLAWWRAGVRPYWPRIRAVLEADLAYRTRQLAEDGFQEVFAHLHPSLRWAEDRLTGPGLPSGGLALDGGGLTLAPSAFTSRCVLLPGREAVPPCLVYPARAVGTLWERRAEPEDGLARLLGRSRAGLLGRTSVPTTTTGLALQTGLSPGAVSQHLAVLRDAGLVTSHRYRREVYYRASELGRALLGGAS